MKMKMMKKTTNLETREIVRIFRSHIKTHAMTKKEIRSQINKAVYEFAEKMGYRISDDGDGGSVTLWKEDEDTADNTIDYHRSHHSACCFNWASAETKADTEAINVFAANQQKMFNI